jgi:hypothetical protein
MLFRVIPVSLLDDAESEDLPWTQFPLTYPRINLPLLDEEHFYEIRFSVDSDPEELPNIEPSHQIVKIEIPASVEILAEETFQDFHSLREVIFAPGSCLKVLYGFRFCSSLSKIELPASIEDMDDGAFERCESLSEVIFAPNSCLKILCGFQCCSSLPKIEIPASVEIITFSAFHRCDSLCEVIVAPDSHLKELYGFQYCYSLLRIQFPASLEFFDHLALTSCNSLCEIIFEGCLCLESIHDLQSSNPVCRIEIQEKDMNLDYNLVSYRRMTNEWSFLLGNSKDYCLIDEPLIDFSSIPDVVVNEGQDLRISRISDRLLCLCAKKQIVIPPFISEIGSCFRSIDGYVETLEIARSIEKIEGFLQMT